MKETMTMADAKKLRAALAERIADAIREFETNTGARVESIEMDRQTYRVTGRPATDKITVSVDVRL